MPARTHGATWRLFSALIAITVLLLTLPLPFVSAADQQDYSATQIENWLVDKIETTTVTVTTEDLEVTLDDTFNWMKIEGFTFKVRGITVGLNYLRLTFNGADTGVEVAGELNVLGKNPHFWCHLDIECAADGIPEVTDISNVKIGDPFATPDPYYEPALSTEDLDTIAEKLNSIIEASEVSIGSPGAELVSIDVVDDGGTAKVELTWSDPTTSLHEASAIQQAVSDAADTLAGKANSYFAEDPARWSIDVLIADGLLQIDCEASFHGITVGLRDFDVDFDTLNASVAEATVYIGTATEDATFTAAGDIAVTGGIPSITMTALTLGDEHPSLRQFVVDIQDALLPAIGQAVDNVVTSTKLKFGLATVDDIAVVGAVLRLTGSTTVAINLDLKQGWNMVSVPVVPTNTSVSAVFHDTEAVYEWDPSTKSYFRPENIAPEKGYWVAVVSDRILNIEGVPVTTWTTDLTKGWNLVGSVYDASVPFTEPNAPPGSVLGYSYTWDDPSTKSYTLLYTLEPTKGHWIAASADCSLIVP